MFIEVEEEVISSRREAHDKFVDLRILHGS